MNVIYVSDQFQFQGNIASSSQLLPRQSGHKVATHLQVLSSPLQKALHGEPLNLCPVDRSVVSFGTVSECNTYVPMFPGDEYSIEQERSIDFHFGAWFTGCHLCTKQFCPFWQIDPIYFKLPATR